MKISIKTEYITLQQLLKITDWISSGGQAKIAVKTLNIYVNKEKEDRRGRKLYTGDIVKIEDKEYEVV
jgi:S4 domain protein YaaA